MLKFKCKSALNVSDSYILFAFHKRKKHIGGLNAYVLSIIDQTLTVTLGTVVGLDEY
jgi:hypothetical protein